MTSLKEQIQKIIYMSIGEQKRIGITWTESETATNEILKLLENRIDERISKITSTEGMDVPNSFHVMGFTKALYEVKEILKQ